MSICELCPVCLSAYKATNHQIVMFLSCEVVERKEIYKNLENAFSYDLICFPSKMFIFCVEQFQQWSFWEAIVFPRNRSYWLIF
jgi:hypothetical protein